MYNQLVKYISFGNINRVNRVDKKTKTRDR